MPETDKPLGAPHEAPRVHPQLSLPRLVRLLKLDQGEASRLINLVCGRKTLGRKCSGVFCWLYVRIRTALTVFVSRFCVFGELRRRYQRTFFKKFACREIFRASSQFEHGTSKSYPNDVTINRIGHCHSSGQEQRSSTRPSGQGPRPGGKGAATKNLDEYRSATMDLPHLAKLFLVLLTLGFAMGFASGYGVRAGISYYRRSLAKRRRVFH